MRTNRRTLIRKVSPPGELEKTNQLWMVIEDIELSFSLFYAQRLYFALLKSRFGKRRELSATMKACFVATLISYRKLAEFFTEPSSTKRFPDDVRSINFGFRVANPPVAKKDLDELSKYAAHFTKTGESLRMRGFDFSLLGNAIYSSCLEFFDFLETKHLDRCVFVERQMLARLYSIRRQINLVTGRPIKNPQKAKS